MDNVPIHDRTKLLSDNGSRMVQIFVAPAIFNCQDGPKIKQQPFDSSLKVRQGSLFGVQCKNSSTLKILFRGNLITKITTVNDGLNHGWLVDVA